MQVTKTEKEDRQVELQIEMTVEEVEPFLEKVAKAAQKHMKLDGFRPGKVPMEKVREQLGEAAIMKDAFLDIVQDALPKAIEQEKLEVVGQPSVDLEKMAPGNPLIFKATMSLMPTVKLGDYKSLKAKAKEVTIDEKELNSTVDALREMRATEKLVLRKAKEGDKTMIDFDITIDGVPIEGGKAVDAPVVLGNGHFLPDIEKNVVGMEAGEEKEFTMSFPADYFKKEVAGKDAQVKVKVKNVYEVELPEMTDEFAATLGDFKTVDDLKKEIEKNMLGEAEMKEKQRLELEILEEIIGKSEFDVFPAPMIDGEIRKMIGELQQDITQRGLEWNQYLTHIKKSEDDLKEEFKEKAQKRLKIAVTSRAIAKEEKIEVSNAEVAAEIEKAKGDFKDSPEQADQFDSPEFKDYAKAYLMNQKTFEKLLSYAAK